MLLWIRQRLAELSTPRERDPVGGLQAGPTEMGYFAVSAAEEGVVLDEGISMALGPGAPAGRSSIASQSHSTFPVLNPRYQSDPALQSLHTPNGRRLAPHETRHPSSRQSNTAQSLQHHLRDQQQQQQVLSMSTPQPPASRRGNDSRGSHSMENSNANGRGSNHDTSQSHSKSQSRHGSKSTGRKK